MKVSVFTWHRGAMHTKWVWSHAEHKTGVVIAWGEGIGIDGGRE